MPQLGRWTLRLAENSLCYDVSRDISRHSVIYERTSFLINPLFIMYVTYSKSHSKCHQNPKDLGEKPLKRTALKRSPFGMSGVTWGDSVTVTDDPQSLGHRFFCPNPDYHFVVFSSFPTKLFSCLSGKSGVICLLANTPFGGTREDYPLRTSLLNRLTTLNANSRNTYNNP